MENHNRKKESADEAELSPHFLEHLTVTENTVLYRAQVAVERQEKTETGALHGAIPKGDDNFTKNESSKENVSRRDAIEKCGENTTKKG